MSKSHFSRLATHVPPIAAHVRRVYSQLLVPSLGLAIIESTKEMRLHRAPQYSTRQHVDICRSLVNVKWLNVVGLLELSIDRQARRGRVAGSRYRSGHLNLAPGLCKHARI